MATENDIDETPDETTEDDTVVTDVRNSESVITEDDDRDDGITDEKHGKREGREARYRTELRAAEAERDTLREQLTAVQRQLIEDRASTKGVNPAALWATTQHNDLLTDTGNVDLTKVDTALVATAKTLGIRNPLVIEAEGAQPNTRPADTFTAAFAPKTN